MPDSLLIIGAGIEQIEAYRIARARGLRVIGTDYNPDAPAFAHADGKLLASTRDWRETCNAALEAAKTENFVGVMTVANDVPYTVAKTAQALGLWGVDPDVALRFTSKLAMKQAFFGAGVAAPDYSEIRSFDDLRNAFNGVTGPVILKPDDGRGSNGVLLLEPGADLEWAYGVSIQASDSKILLLETFIPGSQLSVEGMILGGIYHVIGFADRNYSNMDDTKPYIVENGGTYPARITADTEEQIRRLIEAGAVAMGHTDGNLKADIVIDPSGQPMIIELACRLSGNYLATHHIPYVYGVDLVGCTVDQCLGKPIDPARLAPKSRNPLCVRYFFPEEGIITAIDGAAEVEASDKVLALFIYPKVGDVQPPIQKHGGRAGTVMAKGATQDEAEANADAFAARIRITTEPPVRG